MTTFDEVLVKDSIDFMKKAKDAGKPFFLWHNTTRMHVWTFLSEKYKAMMNPETNYGMEEAGMAQLDDSVGALLKGLDDLGIADNTIVVFSTDNGAEVFTWPDGGMTPFRATKGTVYEGGFRVPAIIRWPGKVPAGKVENSIVSGLDWFPTFVAAAGNPNIVDELKAGKQLGDQTYKVHLDGYDQMDLLTGKGPSKRHEIWYFAESQARRSSPRRLQVSLHRSAGGLAGAEGCDQHADPDQHQAGSFRAYADHEPARWVRPPT